MEVKDRLEELAKKVIPTTQYFRNRPSPIDISYTMGSLQILPKEVEGPFGLTGPVSPRYKELSSNDTRCTHDGLIRMLLGYGKASELTASKTGYEEFNEWFTIHKYEFLKLVQGVYGNLDNIEITYTRSGNNIEYFRDLENAAAFELRAYIKYIGE